MEQVSNLITRKLKAIAEAEDRDLLWFKYKAITVLLPYAVREDRDGRPEMLNAIIHAARASGMRWWDRVTEPLISTLFDEPSPRAAILASPYIRWDLLEDRQDLVRQWIKMVSVAPHTEELAQGVVDTLLQIASYPDLLQHIPPEAWSWLTLRPSLPPVCMGRRRGTDGRIVNAVRALKDIEVLKSYFLLVWSEWDYLNDDGFDETCTSISEDFSGIGMGQHRADLIQRLDHVLQQLDRGLEYLRQQNPYIYEEDLQRSKDQCQKLRGMLLEMGPEAIDCMPHLTMKTLCVLIHALNAYRISHGVHVRTPSPMSVVPG